eukprot:TRINITY_DN17840_c0_g1_i1.p1 TRINITY_DN17840_c0_g1~~TRINITY_DN17840_c0_g1_i1.p1  ORF type:complete len:236 (-),score=11.59 TRINITY_DN17840_c0_g1_i1:45-752(-)
MKRRPPRSTHCISSAASDVYKRQVHGAVSVGYDEKELVRKVTEITQKVLSGEIKHLFVVGLINFPNENRAYFQEFFDNLPDDCFAISLCCPVISDNVFHLKSFYNYSYMEKIFSTMKNIMPLKDLPISVYITRCDKHTISNLLYLNYQGIKNIFMCKCSPNLINPSIIKSIQEIYNIHEFTNPESDIKIALGQELSLIHISEPTRLGMISYAVFCLKKKKAKTRVSQSTITQKQH